jgi:VanZ family protein
MNRTFARIIFWAAMAFALYMALSPAPPDIIDTNDKVQHMLAFATLTIFAVIGFPKMELLRIGERLSFLGALIEVAQSIPALHRDCDITDWIADTVAIVIVLLITLAIRRDRSAQEAETDAAR